MKNISISIFLMFMAFAAVGDIVKSNSASKKTEIIQATGDAFPNPYITDGLIAMWDGEWNKAIGVHDDSATTWNDLTGNRKHTFMLVQGNYVWTDNALFGLDRSRGRLGNLNISSLGEVGTIECVVNPGYGHDNVEFQNGIILEGAYDAGTIATRIIGYASGKCCQVLSGPHYVPWYCTPGYNTRNEDRIVHFGSTIEGTDTEFCFFNGNASNIHITIKEVGLQALSSSLELTGSMMNVIHSMARYIAYVSIQGNCLQMRSHTTFHLTKRGLAYNE